MVILTIIIYYVTQLSLIVLSPLHGMALIIYSIFQVQLSRSTHPGLYAGTRISLRERPIPKPKHGHVDEIDEVDGNTEGGVMPHKLEISPGGTVMEEASTLFCLGSEVHLFIKYSYLFIHTPYLSIHLYNYLFIHSSIY